MSAARGGGGGGARAAAAAAMHGVRAMWSCVHAHSPIY
jgi:hypothetical protein